MENLYSDQEAKLTEKLEFHFNPLYVAIMLIVFMLTINTIYRKIWGYKETLERRLWRKFAYALQEVFPDMQAEEKELLKQTYENTLRNSKAMNIKNKFQHDACKVNSAQSSRILRALEKKKVLFALELNCTHEIPYYSKMFLSE